MEFIRLCRSIMFMLESEQIQHQLKLNTKRKNKSMKDMMQTNFRVKRKPSKQFNDPIYAGFDVNEQNRQLAQWGPWITNTDSPIKNTYSLHSSMKKILVKQISSQNTLILKKNLLSNTPLIMPRSTSINQLPHINQTGKSRQKMLRRDELIQKKIIDTRLDLKFTQKVKQTIKNEKNTPYRPIQYNKNRVRLGTVVYNYCTNYNDDCLLNYHRKSEPVLEKISKKQDLIITKKQGFKQYWRKRNQKAQIKID